MSDSGPTPEQKKQQKKSDDEACGRLMEVYVQEAKQYDEGLVKSWKEDMDVTLVFSGLYSAVLTAFVIESYQKLQEDPVDTSVALLRQLVSISNSSDIVSAAQDEFTPTPAAVACNILWFLSLILALCCAFLATFVQQWSRQFMHKSGLLRSSTAHARLYSFLYFGLKNFQMHTVVNVIPSMLHLSLFLFLGGLIAFLRDVNPVLTYIVVGALTVVTFIYLAFTIWPLLAPSSPYQTPFSPIAWQIWAVLTFPGVPFLKALWKKWKKLFQRIKTRCSSLHPILPTNWNPPPQLPSFWRKIIASLSPLSTHLSHFPQHISTFFTSVYGILKKVVAEKREMVTVTPHQEKTTHSLSSHVVAASQTDHADRDAQAISWTLSSITDDPQLLQFVEALPDAIYGPDGIRDNNLHLIKALVETTEPQCDIILRIISLMSNVSNSWFDEKHRNRCAIACPKALWALAFIVAERRDQFDLAKASRKCWFPEHLLDALDEGSLPSTGDTPGRKYAISAAVLCASTYRITSSQAAFGIARFLHASMEVEPFEFEQTCQALSEYLSREIASDDKSSNNTFCTDVPIPQIQNEEPLPRGQIARLDVITGLCLQLPKSYSFNTDSVQYIYQRVEMEGWGSTPRIWNNCSSLRALDGCGVGRDFCNAMREYLYTLFLGPTSMAQNIEPPLQACVRKLGEHSNNANDQDSDTSQIALQTMIAMRIVLVDTPGGAEVPKDFQVVRQYVEQNVLRLEAELWTWDDPRYGEGVKVGRVVILTTRLLQRFMMSADDPVATNDILDALEFILFIGYIDRLFEIHPDESSLQPVGEDFLVIFSKITLDICHWWSETPSEWLSSNTVDIVAWMWQVWGNLKLPQSEEATRNLAQAATLMVSHESMGKVEECKSKEASRVPAPHPRIAGLLGIPFFENRLDFKRVLSRYTYSQNDDQSMHSQGLTSPSDNPNHSGDSAIVEEGPGVDEDGDGNKLNNNLSSSIPQGPSSLPLPNDPCVI